MISGTTGESPTLTKEEKLRLFREIKNELGDRGAVVAGTGNYSTAESIELTQEAEREGADAGPCWLSHTTTSLHRRACTGTSGLLPRARGCPASCTTCPAAQSPGLSWETTVKLAQVDNIIGVKEASGDFDQIARIISGSPKDFRVWSGNDNDTFGIMSLGGYGVVSVASHLVGSQIKAMMDLVSAGDTAQAAAEHLRLLPIFKGLFVLSNPIPVKYSLNHVGFSVGSPRLPLTEPDEKTAEQLQSMLSDYRIDIPVAAGA